MAYSGLLGKTYDNPDYGLSFRHPHSLSAATLTGFTQRPKVPRDLTKILLSAENSSPSFSLTVKAHPNDLDGKDPDLLRYVEAVDPTSFLVENFTITGKKAYRIAYSYLEEHQAKDPLFPSFIQVYTDILITEKNIFSFTYKAESSQFKEGLSVYDNILKSLTFGE